MTHQSKLFPSQKLVIIRGDWACARYSMMRYIDIDLKKNVAAKTDAFYPSMAMSHLIVKGLLWYMTHPIEGGWDLHYVDGSYRMNGLCVLKGENYPVAENQSPIGSGHLLRIVGREPRKTSVGTSLTIPTAIWDLCEQYVQTSWSFKMEVPSATLWIAHLTARGLWVYEQEAKTKTHPVEVNFQDGFFGVPASDFPDWVRLPARGSDETRKCPTTKKI